MSFYDNFHQRSRSYSRIIDVNNFTYIHILNQLKNLISNKHRRLKILDFGCGVGSIALYLASIGHLVYGVDISPRAIEKAKESASRVKLHENASFDTTKNFNTNNYKNFFDLILCTEVIEHVQDDKSLVTSLFKMCKRGGCLIVSTPSKNSPLYKMGLLSNFDSRVGHIRRYSVPELINILKDSGFTPQKITELEGLLRNGLYTFNTLGFLLKFIKGPIVSIVTKIDNQLAKIFGGADILVVAKKQ